MKKNIMRAALIAAMTAGMVTACDKSQKSDTSEPAAKAEAPAELKIAYVEVDSIMTQYQFCKDYTQILTKKGQNIEATIQKKGEALQAAANNFQQKLQNNGFASREQAASVQAAIQRQDQDLQELQNRLGSELDAETAKFNKSLRDSIQNFLKDYNKTKKYDLIISKAGDNILYADKKHEITQDVINGLNKRYKSTLKEADKK